MLCDICHQAEATIHIREFCDGKLKSLNLCQACAEKRAGASSAFGKIGIDLPGMLRNVREGKPPLEGLGNDDGEVIAVNVKTIKGEIPEKNESAKPDAPEFACPVCGTRPDALHTAPGCPECFRAHEKFYAAVIASRNNGVNTHTGTAPTGNAADLTRLMTRLTRFKADLQAFAEQEDYKRAAECRDRIAELEKQIKLCAEKRKK